MGPDCSAGSGLRSEWWTEQHRELKSPTSNRAWWPLLIRGALVLSYGSSEPESYLSAGGCFRLRWFSATWCARSLARARRLSTGSLYS